MSLSAGQPMSGSAYRQVVEAREALIEELGQALHGLAQDDGEDLSEWDFGPAEYMRHLFCEQARRQLEAFESLGYKLVRESEPKTETGGQT